MTPSVLKHLVDKYMGVTLHDVTHIHFSPDCTTMSSADKGRSRYRLPDGRPNVSYDSRGNPVVPADFYQSVYDGQHHGLKALRCDMAMNAVLFTLSDVSADYVTMLITVENPSTGCFSIQPVVQDMLQHGFMLYEVDYCSVASPRWDGNDPWTMKPTHILAKGLHASHVMPRCQGACRYRFPDSPYHRYVIRKDCYSKDEQQKLEGWRREAIPQGLFEHLSKSHDQYLYDTMPNTVVKRKNKMMLPLGMVQHDDQVRLAEVCTAKLKPSQRWFALQHARYGHAGIKRLRKVKAFSKYFRKMKLAEVPCQACFSSKACKKAHTGHLQRANYPLGLVHMDLQGPFQVPDLDGNYYQAVIVDDYTRRKWVRRLRTKGEFGKEFRLWIAQVGAAPTRARTDFGGEFMAEAINGFLQVCEEKSIHPERSVPKNSEQNGVAERANRTLLEMARSMLVAAQLPKNCWGHAFMHAAYIDQFIGGSDGSPSPYEMWYGAEPEPDLIVFGAKLTFAHDEQRGKLDSPGHQGIYLGNSQHTDGYYVLDLTNEKEPLRINRDILRKSIDESHCVVTEPIGVSAEDYELLKGELQRVREAPLHESEPMVVNEEMLSPIAQEVRMYNRAKQNFFTQHRQRLQMEGKSAEEAEEWIRMMWKARELAIASKERAERREQQEFSKACKELEQAQLNYEQSVKAELSKHASRKRKGERTDPISTAEDVLSQQPTQPVASTPHHDDTAVQSSGRRTRRRRDVEQSVGDSKRSSGQGDTLQQVLSDVDGKWDKTKDKCEVCKDWQCNQHALLMLQCDGCDKFYHKKCLSMRWKPRKSDMWLCHSCIRPHQRIEVFWPKDKLYHSATVTMQYKEGQGTDILYDTGELQHLDLNFERWRPEPISRADSYVHSTGIMDDDTMKLVHNVMYDRTPKTHRELMRLPEPDRQAWIESENKEFNAIVNEHKALKLLHAKDIPRGADIIGTHWVYVTKSSGRKKSRMVLQGNQQSRDENVSVESPTPKLSTIRHTLSVAVKQGWTIDVVDVNGAFLLAQPSKPTYIRLPAGRKGEGGEEYALCLKNVYGAYDGPLQWNMLLHNWMTSIGFQRNAHDPCLYERVVNEVPIYVICHVDDLAIVSSRQNTDDFKRELGQMFKYSEEHASKDEEGEFVRYLGMELRRSDDELVITQHHLINQLYTKASKWIPSGMKNPSVPMRVIHGKLDKSTSPSTPEDVKYWSQRPYRQLLGICGFLCLVTRIECCFAYKTLATFSNCYGKDHWQALLELIMYIYSTRKTNVLVFSKSGGNDLSGYCDADWGGMYNSKSTSGWILFHGSNPIQWCSRTQKNITRSVGEAEYVSLAELCVEAAHQRMLGISLGQDHGSTSIMSNNGSEKEPGCVRIWQESDEYKKMSGRNKIAQAAKASVQEAVVWTDSANAIAFATKDWVADKLRHVKICWHFFKQYVKNKEITLQHVPTASNAADILTKPWGEALGAKNQKAQEFSRHAQFLLGRRTLQ